MKQSMRAIDLEYQVRERLFECYAVPHLRFLQAILPDGLPDLFQIAWDVVPKLWPERDPDVAARLSDLAADMPDLLTREPSEDAAPGFDYDLLPLTPLRLLHANVIELALEYARGELERLPQLEGLSGGARRLYGAMRKRYVENGYRERGAMSLLTILGELEHPPEWRYVDRAHPVLQELVAAALIETPWEGAKAYRLTAPQCAELASRFILREKWLSCYSSEIARVQEEAAAQRRAAGPEGQRKEIGLAEVTKVPAEAGKTEKESKHDDSTR